jgi:TetR/AcrR family transcriptional repressor of bet genes
MPKIVDPDRRREEIAVLTLDVIRSVGIDRASIRGIAERGGVSMSVLTHYFRNKDDLVSFAFRWLSDQTFAELDLMLATRPAGLARLEAALDAMFPRSGETTTMALWTSVWDRATRNPAFAREHRAYYARWRSYVTTFLSDAVARRQVPRDLCIADVTDLLVAAVDGLWIASALEPKRFAGTRRRAVLARLVDGLTERGTIARTRRPSSTSTFTGA